MKTIFIHLLMIIISISTIFSQNYTYSKYDFFKLANEHLESGRTIINISSGHLFYDKNFFTSEQYFEINFEEVFDPLKYGAATMFFLKKEFYGNEKDSLFNKKTTNEKLKKYVINLLRNNTEKLTQEFDVYVFLVDKNDIEPFEDGTESGGTYIDYFPKEGALYYGYKYTSKGWLLFINDISCGSLTQDGKQYLNHIAQIKVLKYLYTLSSNYISEEKTNYVKSVFEIIEILSKDIETKDTNKYNIDLQNLEKFMKATKIDMSEDFFKINLHIVVALKAIELAEAPELIEDKEFFFQSRASINTLYSCYGYKFKNKQWFDIFSQFKWYNPNTNNPKLTEPDEIIINQLILEEKVKKAN